MAPKLTATHRSVSVVRVQRKSARSLESANDVFFIYNLIMYALENFHEINLGLYAITIFISPILDFWGITFFGSTKETDIGHLKNSGSVREKYENENVLLSTFRKKVKRNVRGMIVQHDKKWLLCCMTDSELIQHFHKILSHVIDKTFLCLPSF